MSRPRRRRARRRLRVLVLLETGRAPPEDVDALTDQERYEFKMEIDYLRVAAAEAPSSPPADAVTTGQALD